MKRIFFLIITIPFFAFSQSSSEINISSSKDFEISGNVSGYEDGTSVSFLNQQTGVPEKQATIEKGKFLIKGNLKEPSFIVLIFGDQPPAISLFIDNSKIKIEGDKNNLENLSITGSKSQDEFAEYSKEIKPYEKIFAEGAEKDAASVAAVEKASENFVKKHPSSFVGPIAIIRVLQSSENEGSSGGIPNGIRWRRVAPPFALFDVRVRTSLVPTNFHRDPHTARRYMRPTSPRACTRQGM